MFDTMTLTKAVGGLCAALLILLLGGWVASGLFSVGGGGHGDHHVAGYVIDTGEDDHGGEEVEEVPFSEYLAAANPDDAGRLFRACLGCHSVDPAADGSAGPSLYGVVGRDIAGRASFGYSDAMAAVEGAWTPEALNEFLENPRANIQGTSMGYNGIRDVEDRAAVVAYLQTLSE